MEFRSIPTVNGHQIGKFDPAYDFLLAEEPVGFEGDRPRWVIGDIEYQSDWVGQQLRVTRVLKKPEQKAERVRATREPQPNYDVPLPSRPSPRKSLDEELQNPPDGEELMLEGIMLDDVSEDLSVRYKGQYAAFRQRLREESVEPHPLQPFKSTGKCPQIIRDWLEFLHDNGVLHTDHSMRYHYPITNDLIGKVDFIYPTRVQLRRDDPTGKPTPPNWGIFDDNHSIDVPDTYPFIACRQALAVKLHQYTWFVIGHYFYYTDPVGEFADEQFEFTKCSTLEFEKNTVRYVGGARSSCITLCRESGVDTNKTEGPGLLVPTRYAYDSGYMWLSWDSMRPFVNLDDARAGGVKDPVPVLDLMDFGDYKSVLKIPRWVWPYNGLSYRLNIYARRCVVIKEREITYYLVIRQYRSATAWSNTDWDTSAIIDKLACAPVIKLPPLGLRGIKLLDDDARTVAEKDLIGRVDMKLVLQSGAVVGASVLVGIALYYQTGDATLSTLVAGGVLLVGGTAVVILNIEQLTSILNRVLYENPLVAVAGTGIAAAGAFGAGTALIKKFI